MVFKVCFCMRPPGHRIALEQANAGMSVEQGEQYPLLSAGVPGSVAKEFVQVVFFEFNIGWVAGEAEVWAFAIAEFPDKIFHFFF